MEDSTAVSASSCADLERLATAAATLGYSTDTIHLPSHHVVNSNVNATSDQINLQPTNGISSAMVHQYSSTPYDLPRTQQYTIRVAEFHPQNRGHQNVNQQMISQNHPNATTRIGTHYAVIGNPESSGLVIPRSPNFGQTVMTAKAINISNGTPSVHYFPIDTRNFHNSTETVAVAGGGGVQIGNAPVISSQPIIHFVPQAPPQSLPPPPHSCSSEPSHQSVLVQPPTVPEPQQQHHEAYQPHDNQAPQQPIEQFSQEVKEKSQDCKSPTPVKKKVNKKTKLKKRPLIKNGVSNGDEDDLDDEEDDKAKSTSVVPDPVDINGKKYFVCGICEEKFLRKYLFKRHQICHTGEKRGALTLETKAEIIKRIKCGEKQVDLAMEYNVGRSTLSFIMKNAEKFLGLLENGKFHPDRKRLRGAQREDVEAALFEWYKQASQVGVAISGPILCRKARDFASKLGYQEFKATHGWLDRFKRRKHIILGRSKSLKDKDNVEETEDFKVDFTEIILPNILSEYASNDVFHASEVGLLYKVFPSKAPQFKGTRCAGGTNSKKRVTLLLCCNMTGSEKFPLFIIGKHTKPKCFHNVKSLPVQYIANENAWITKENFAAWLNDLNSWFAQQNRKVLLVVPYLPVHPKAPKLSAVKVIVSPANFIGPSKLGISYSLKRNFRRSVLESLLSHMEDNSKMKRRSKRTPYKLTLLSCLHKLAAAWHSVTDITISNSFQRSAIRKCNLWGINLSSESILGSENLDLLHRLKSYGLKIPNSFTFDDYVTFDDEVQVCHFMDDDDIIASVTGNDVESTDSEEESGGKRGEGEENPCPSFAEVERNFNIVRSHVAQEFKGSQEICGILSHLEYLLQTSAKNATDTYNSQK